MIVVTMRHENRSAQPQSLICLKQGCTFQMSTQEMAEYLVSGEAGGIGSRRLAQLQSARQAVDKMSSADKKKLVASR